jgi:hypothetical protein
LNEIIFLHYNGLGDYLICNGLVNALSKLVDTLHLPIPQCYENTLKFLYSENHKVKLFFSDVKLDDENLNIYAKTNNLPIITKCYEYGFNRKTFQKDLYKSMNIPYNARYEYWHIPDNPNSYNLYLKQNLKDYIFVHDTFAWQKQNLKINTNKKIFYPHVDMTNNLFHYVDIIKNAQEIHCVDSCFYHLIENMQIKNIPKYYHDIRNAHNDKMPCSDDWIKINYE